MTTKLILALDFEKQKDALTLIDKLSPTLCAVKVGSEMFTLWGPQFVKQLIARQFKVFLDLKFHDIPNTVAKACMAAADLGVWMMNVHASGGLKMMQSAAKALESYGSDKPLLIAVTVLTSLSQQELMSVGVNHSLMKQVVQLASLAQDAELDGVVCSAHEVSEIKRLCNSNFIAVTPGIRLANQLNAPKLQSSLQHKITTQELLIHPVDSFSSCLERGGGYSGKDDQVRIMTPKQAINAGSDYLVIGRPVTQAADPALTINEILNDIS